MAGRPGRSGGHNRISLEAHVLRGTFNPTRHSPKTPPGSSAWAPPAAALETIGPVGRAFIERQRASYEFSPLEGEVVIELAIMADRLNELRTARPSVAPDDREDHDKLELAWQRAYTTGLGWLRSRARARQSTTRAPASKWGGLFDA